MRIPDDRPPGFPQPKQGEQSMRYLAPGAFTILPPGEHYQDPPPASAPAPYKYEPKTFSKLLYVITLLVFLRLTPTSRRHKKQSFSIIAEPISNPGSRSPSPSGRVSPFRGRGFNPAGSRLASPAPSPPPQERSKYSHSQKSSPKKSQIPLLTRKSSDSLFGESVKDGIPHSKSTSSLHAIKKPPPGSRRTGMYTKATAFQQLSPIIGSSPEPATPEQNKSQSSRIPRSRSTPPSRQTSPARKPPLPDSRQTPKLQSRSESKEEVGSPAKKSFKNVQAKVNSFNRVKPKVPPKPQNDETGQNGVLDAKKQKAQVTRKESGTKIVNSGSKGSLMAKNGGSNVVVSASSKAKTEGSSSSINGSNKTINSSTNNVNNNVVTNKDSVVNNSNNSVNTDKSTTKSVTNENNKENVVNNNISAMGNVTKTNIGTTLNGQANAQNVNREETALPKVPSTVVTTNNNESSTIEAVMDDFVKGSNDKITPIVDGRVLSATSVSNAMNKMNDTVLSTNTLLKDHNFTKISPAASAIISMSSAAHHNRTYDSKNLTDSSENEDKNKIPSKGTDGPNGTLNRVHSGGNAEFVRLGHTVSNLNKFSGERLAGLGTGNSVQKSINDRIIDSNAVVAADVKPLRITVKEKPQNVDVQSGNVRPAAPTINGISEATPG